MQFENLVSLALLAIMVTMSMAAPLPAVPATEVDNAAPKGKTRKIEKVDDTLRNFPDGPDGCIDWVKVGTLMGYCHKWEDVLVREEDIPEDIDGKPPKIGAHNDELQTTPERPVDCVDWVKVGRLMGYCRELADVEFDPEEEAANAKPHDHSMRTSRKRPTKCVDWMQVGRSTGYCMMWMEEVAKRDAKSVLNIAMPFWTVGAL